jgi:hypothetical protein
LRKFNRGGEKMKKLMVLLAGLGFLLIAGGFEKTSAQERQIVYRVDTLGQGQVIIRQPVGVKAKTEKSFIYAEPDPVNPGKIAGEIMGGGVAATLGGILGAGLGYAVTYNGNRSEWFNTSGVPGAVIGYAIASNIGCALGVYLIGNSGNEKGSFSNTLGGSITGSLVGGGLVYLLYKGNHGESQGSPTLYYFIAAAAQTTGAVIGFNHSRKKKVEAPTGALLNLDDERLSLSFPQVNLSDDSKSPSSYKINFFQAKF